MDFPEPEENSTSHSALNEAPFHSMARYRECLKNHAAALGGNAIDGCREFMPCGSGAGGALKCSACGCHRNFHRKEAEGRQPRSSSYSFEHQRYYQPPLHLQGVIMPRPYSAVAPALIQPHPEQPETVKKRIRTKFTVEQKEKMLGYAEKAGWRLPRHDDGGLLKQFCEETGVKRRVLKVWMHNNKHKHFASKNDSIAKNE